MSNEDKMQEDFKFLVAPLGFTTSEYDLAFSAYRTGFNECSKQKNGEIAGLREKLAAQQARISELKSCLLDIGSGKGDWAWEEVAAQEDGTEGLAAIKAAEYQRGAIEAAHGITGEKK